jgi:hypothetical protein
VVDFVEEVEEQLRSDRYLTLARRVLPWLIVAVVALVVGWLAVWGYNSWLDRNVASASIGYDKGITALAQGDETGAYTAFDAIGKSGPPAYKSLALIQQGNIRLAANKTEEAVAFYDAAAKAAPNAIFGDMARIKAALALLDTAPYPQLQVRLQALIGDKKPYAIQAREALALAKLLAGKTQEARGDLTALGLMLGVTDAMRARDRAAIAMIDAGESVIASHVIKTAATLPPPNPATLTAPPGAAAGAAAPGDQENPDNASPDAAGNAP